MTTCNSTGAGIVHVFNVTCTRLGSTATLKVQDTSAQSVPDNTGSGIGLIACVPSDCIPNEDVTQYGNVYHPNFIGTGTALAEFIVYTSGDVSIFMALTGPVVPQPGGSYIYDYGILATQFQGRANYLHYTV